MGVSLSSIMNVDMKDFYSSYYSLVFFQCSFHPWIICWPSRFSGRLPYSDVYEKGSIIRFFAFSKLLLKIFFGLPHHIFVCNLLEIILFPIFLICTKFIWGFGCVLFFLMPFNNIEQPQHICHLKKKCFFDRWYEFGPSFM